MQRIQQLFIFISLAVLFLNFTGTENHATLDMELSFANSMKIAVLRCAKWVDTSLSSITPGLPGVMAHDKDVISFFDSICPQGWVPYEKARNKFILGSNTDDEIGTVGGSDKVTLTVDNLPSHTHYSFSVQGTRQALTTENYPNRNRLDAGNGNYDIQGSDYPGTHGRTSASGGGQQFQITPPYIKLKLCQKQNENVIVPELQAVETNLNNHIADFEAFKPQVQQLQNDLNSLKDKYNQLDEDFEDYRGYALTFHVIAVVALIFLIFDMIMWLISISRIRRLERDAQALKYPDTPRQTAEKYR